MYTYQLRRDSFADWARKNPVLRAGEPGYEYDTGKLRIGDGYTPFIKLKTFLPGLSTDGGTETVTDAALIAHINAIDPHPVYDDGPSLLLLYQNAKV